MLPNYKQLGSVCKIRNIRFCSEERKKEREERETKQVLVELAASASEHERGKWEQVNIPVDILRRMLLQFNVGLRHTELLGSRFVEATRYNGKKRSEFQKRVGG